MSNSRRNYILLFASLCLTTSSFVFSRYEGLNFLNEFQNQLQEPRANMFPQEQAPRVPAEPAFRARRTPVVNQPRQQVHEWVMWQPGVITRENIETLRREHPGLTTLILEGDITVATYELLRRYLGDVTVLINVNDDFIPLDQYFRRRIR
jgi:hypothetical protein